MVNMGKPELTGLIDSKRFGKYVKGCTGYPNFSKIEKGFVVYENMLFSEIFEGSKEGVRVNYSDDKNFIFHVHSHISQCTIVPSLKDFVSEFYTTIEQGRKGLVPFFGIISRDMISWAKRRKFLKYGNDLFKEYEKEFPEMLVYSLRPLFEKYGDFPDKKLGIGEIYEHGNLSIEKDGFLSNIFFNDGEKKIPYDELPEEDKKIICVEALRMDKQIAELAERSVAENDDKIPYFDIITDVLKRIDGLEVVCLKKYNDL